jgi:hypothetical protein
MQNQSKFILNITFRILEIDANLQQEESLRVWNFIFYFLASLLQYCFVTSSNITLLGFEGEKR